MGKMVIRNPRIVVITDHIFGSRKEVHADIYDEDVGFSEGSNKLLPVRTFIATVGLGKPVTEKEKS